MKDCYQNIIESKPRRSDTVLKASRGFKRVYKLLFKNSTYSDIVYFNGIFLRYICNALTNDIAHKVRLKFITREFFKFPSFLSASLSLSLTYIHGSTCKTIYTKSPETECLDPVKSNFQAKCLCASSLKNNMCFFKR